MAFIEKLPWYDDYSLILDSCRLAEQGVEELENPEKQFQRIKKFYVNLGADYSKNDWLLQAEKDISVINHGDDGRLNQLKMEVRFGTALENAVQKQDDESIRALISFKDIDKYKQLIRNVMFYIGVSKVKTDPSFIKTAYDEIVKRYPLQNVELFTREGCHYFSYYYYCLHYLLRNNRGKSSYISIRQQIEDRCLNDRLMFNSYKNDMYIAEEAKEIVMAILELESELDK